MIPDPKLRSVSGLRAIVTGAASGMGAATACLFASEGAHVALIDRDAEGLATVADAIAKAGGRATAFTFDLADSDAIKPAILRIADQLGGLDIVVNNAGIAGFCAMDADGYDGLWQRMVTINLTAIQVLVRAALPWLRQSPCPRIVNIASTEALGAAAHNSAYAAVKAGVTGLTRAMAVEFGPAGITANCICPGPIVSPMTSFVSEEHKQLFARRRTALNRYGEPGEVAQMTLSLCLPGASYITGATIPVDGGLMARNG